jgi:biopolymer transport protein TolR
LRLTAHQRRFVRRALARAAAAPSETGGELNIVPLLDVVMNLIVFLMATMAAATALAMIVSAMPPLGPSRGTERVPLGLGVVLTSEGIVVTSARGKYATGCATFAEGRVVTVPIDGGGYDWSALGECLGAIKSAHPDETEIAVSAEPLVAYEDLVGAMDAARASGERELFPEVLVSAGVR